MEVRIANKQLALLECEPSNGGHPPGVARAFRKRLQLIRNSAEERDLRAMKSNHFEKLKGDRGHQYSVRLNDQYRLVFELADQGSRRVIVIRGIEDNQ